MAFYFIDYENIRESGLKGIDKLDEKDEIFLFYSEHANTISFPYA